jgi:hypothetical protein
MRGDVVQLAIDVEVLGYQIHMVRALLQHGRGPLALLLGIVPRVAVTEPSQSA